MNKPDRLGRGAQLDRILEQVDSKYTAVIMISKRARQIVAAQHEEEAGSSIDKAFDERGQLPVIDPGINAVGDATRELMAGKLRYHHRDPMPGSGSDADVED